MVYRLICLMAVCFWGVGAVRAEALWQKVAPAPKDLLGRELPPGVGAAFCYVPPWKGFLIYGGYWPTYTNAGWLYRPQSGQLELLWPCDLWGWDAQGKRYFVRLPRQVRWSQDRPGPARGMAAVYCPPTGKVYLIGGHPWRNREWFGNTRLGTWELDPRTRRFRFVSAQGPQGLTRAVYAANVKRIVAAPQPGQRRGETCVVWQFDPRRRRWARRVHPQGPRPTPHAAFAYDEQTGLCVYFNALGETWVYDPRGDRWQQRRPQPAPPARWHAAFAYHPGQKRLILYGGVALSGGKSISERSGYGPLAWHDRHGTSLRDTWAYDAKRDRWEQLSPGRSGAPRSVQEACVWDPEAEVLVCFDPVEGILTLGRSRAYRRARQGVQLVVSAEQKKQMARRLRPADDPALRNWQRTLQRLPADTWADPGIRTPSFGDISYDYHPEADCLYWIGGCLGAVARTYEDYSYTNQVVVFDMEVGRWQLRRANHPWMPPEAARLRPGNGCGRGFCYDPKRQLIWTVGGVTGVGLGGSRGMQAYDLLADRFFPTARGTRGWGSNCGLVYLAAADWLLAVSGGYQPLDTFAFHPAKRVWAPRAAHPPKRSQYSRVVYDEQLGVLLLAQVPKEGWRPGQSLSRQRMLELMKQYGWENRVYRYDPRANAWQELQAENGQLLQGVVPEGVTLDTRHRALLVFAQEERRRPIRVWALDLNRLRWQRATSSPPVGALHAGSTVYVPRHNVVAVAAGGRLYLYRWQGSHPKP